MTILNILFYPEKILNEETLPINIINDEIKILVKDMTETLESNGGLGLAAPQVGHNKKLIVYKYNNKISELMNPEIIFKDGEILSGEGCLSLPACDIHVKRAKRIKVKGIDLSGEKVNIDTYDMLSIILQHEIDHLNGILLIDHISSLKRQMCIKKIKNYKKLANRNFKRSE